MAGDCEVDADGSGEACLTGDAAGDAGEDDDEDGGTSGREAEGDGGAIVSSGAGCELCASATTGDGAGSRTMTGVVGAEPRRTRLAGVCGAESSRKGKSTSISFSRAPYTTLLGRDGEEVGVSFLLCRLDYS